MAITPINNAVIQRTADVNIVKHQEDAKSTVDQQNIQLQVNQREDVLNHQVIQPGNSSQTQNDKDAKDEGKGRDFGGKGKQKKKSSEHPEDRVVKKQNKNSFDIKI